MPQPFKPIVCPTNFQPLPDWDLLRFVPEDTQVLLIGEWHRDVIQRKYFNNNLYALNRAGFSTLTVELPHDGQQETEEYFAAFSENLQLLKKRCPTDNGKENAFYDSCSVVSEYHILSQARSLGMKTKWADVECDGNSREDKKAFDRRNIKMAQEIIELSKNGKVVHWVGNAHLYGSSRQTFGDNSIQEYLQLEGLKTYTIGLVPGLGELFERNFAPVAETDGEIYNNLKTHFRENFGDEQKIKPVRIDLHALTDKAGDRAPDELYVFSQNGYEWSQIILGRDGPNPSVDTEQGIWQVVHSKKIKSAQIA